MSTKIIESGILILATSTQVRSSRQDYIHSSIVSTLLALMDGLDKRCTETEILTQDSCDAPVTRHQTLDMQCNGHQMPYLSEFMY